MIFKRINLKKIQQLVRKRKIMMSISAALGTCPGRQFCIDKKVELVFIGDRNCLYYFLFFMQS